MWFHAALVSPERRFLFNLCNENKNLHREIIILSKQNGFDILCSEVAILFAQDNIVWAQNMDLANNIKKKKIFQDFGPSVDSDSLLK